MEEPKGMLANEQSSEVLAMATAEEAPKESEMKEEAEKPENVDIEKSFFICAVEEISRCHRVDASSIPAALME